MGDVPIAELDKAVLSALPADLAASICDLGCGYGAVLRALALRGYTDLVRVDHSDELRGLMEFAHLGFKFVSQNAFEF